MELKKVIACTRDDGFSLVEILLACAIFAMTVTAVSGAIIYGNSAGASAGKRNQAVMLADEGLQAARNIRNAGYANLSDGTFGVTTTSGVFGLSGASDTSGIYTRQVTVASNGAKRKTVTSTVSWSELFGGTRSFSVSTELTNWIATIKTWPGAIQYGSLDLPSTDDGFRVDTSGKYAYVVRSSGTPNFYVIDISTPTAPVIVSSLTLTGSLTDVRVSGNYAYVSSTDGSNEFQVVNVATPSSPTLAGTYNAPGSAAGAAVFIYGNYAFLARNNNGGTGEFLILNITTPSAPTLAYSYGSPGNMTDVVLLNGYVYLATSTGVVIVINVSSILNLLGAQGIVAANYSPPGTGAVTAIDVYGSNLLIGRGSTLSTATIGLLGAPAFVGSTTMTGSGTINYIDADPNSGYGFVGTSYTAGEFQVLGLQTFTSPSVVRTVDIPGTASNLTGVAYNATYDVVVGASAYDSGEVQVFGKN